MIVMLTKVKENGKVSTRECIYAAGHYDGQVSVCIILYYVNNFIFIFNNNGTQNPTLCLYQSLYCNMQRKCEKYWTDDLDQPYNAGGGFTVVTTGCRGFADYVIRDLAISSVRLISSMNAFENIYSLHT